MTGAPRAARTVLVILPAAMILGLLIASLVRRRERRPPRTGFKLVASSLWTLDHLCLSMGTVLREWPELREIRVDVGALSALDHASTASVRCAIDAAAAAGVDLCFDGCNASMASFLLSSGVEVKCLGARRDASTKSSETLH
jgi:hypothetical protein